MLVRTETPDPAMARIQACWLTELALGEDRHDTAFRLVCASLSVLTDEESGGTRATILAERLRDLAEKLVR